MALAVSRRGYHLAEVEVEKYVAQDLWVSRWCRQCGPIDVRCIKIIKHNQLIFTWKRSKGLSKLIHIGTGTIRRNINTWQDYLLSIEPVHAGDAAQIVDWLIVWQVGCNPLIQAVECDEHVFMMNTNALVSLFVGVSNGTASAIYAILHCKNANLRPCPGA